MQVMQPALPVSVGFNGRHARLGVSEMERDRGQSRLAAFETRLKPSLRCRWRFLSPLWHQSRPAPELPELTSSPAKPSMAEPKTQPASYTRSTPPSPMPPPCRIAIFTCISSPRSFRCESLSLPPRRSLPARAPIDSDPSPPPTPVALPPLAAGSEAPPGARGDSSGAAPAAVSLQGQVARGGRVCKAGRPTFHAAGWRACQSLHPVPRGPHSTALQTSTSNTTAPCMPAPQEASRGKQATKCSPLLPPCPCLPSSSRSTSQDSTPQHTPQQQSAAQRSAHSSVM